MFHGQLLSTFFFLFLSNFFKYVIFSSDLYNVLSLLLLKTSSSFWQNFISRLWCIDNINCIFTNFVWIWASINSILINLLCFSFSLGHSLCFLWTLDLLRFLLCFFLNRLNCYWLIILNFLFNFFNLRFWQSWFLNLRSLILNFGLLLHFFRFFNFFILNCIFRFFTFIFLNFNLPFFFFIFIRHSIYQLRFWLNFNMGFDFNLASCSREHVCYFWVWRCFVLILFIRGVCCVCLLKDLSCFFCLLLL